MNISDIIKKTYQSKFNKFGVDPKSLQWNSKGAAHQRFRQIWCEIDFTNKSVLDVGCGFGELGKFLTRKFENVSYTGIDIVPEFINEAKLLYPKLNFVCGDYFFEPLPQKFDIVVCSGALNVNTKDNTKYREDAIKTMFNGAKKALVFNMLGSHPQPQTKENSNVWYADSIEVLSYCLTLTHRVILRHHYHPRDFTIYMFKESEKKITK